MKEVQSPNDSTFVLDARTYQVDSLQKAAAFLKTYFEGIGRVKISRMPVKRSILTNNKAHHIHKLSQESFEVRRMSWVFTLEAEMGSKGKENPPSQDLSQHWHQLQRELPLVAWKVAPGVGFRFRSA